jgi:hypothetical protein
MRFLRATLWVGAVADLISAALVLLPARGIMDGLGIPVGEPVLHFRFAGLLYALLPIFYILGAVRSDLTVSMAGAATLARAGGTIFLLVHLSRGEAVSAYWYFAVLEAAMGLAHWLGLRLVGLTVLGALRGTDRGVAPSPHRTRDAG